LVPNNPFYSVLKSRHYTFDSAEMGSLFDQVNPERVMIVAQILSEYLRANLPSAIDKRSALIDYRTNPYVLMTAASVMSLDSPPEFSTFLFNSKLYMALETSFGKSIEAIVSDPYPHGSIAKWSDPQEKRVESELLAGLSQEDKARQRMNSVWREIDKSVIVADRRYLLSIKSGPNTINDTQVQAMTRAIIENHKQWFTDTLVNHPSTSSLDIVLGLTYGTNKTTNNKENQILAKLLDHGFVEQDRERNPGVLVHKDESSIRVYRVIGQEFWAFIGQPGNPSLSQFIFLEVLLSLAKALSQGFDEEELEDRINRKMRDLAASLLRLQLPRNSLPAWVRQDFSDDELFWFATAMTAFYDDGI